MSSLTLLATHSAALLCVFSLFSTLHICE